MVYTTLVDTAAVEHALDTADWAIVDCRFRLEEPSWGEREYLSAHIPGASYAHLDRDLSGKLTGSNGRHPLPSPTTLRRTLGRLGISAGQQVVAYDQDSGLFASRLWWLLRWMGHSEVAVLDGGFGKWITEGRQTRAGHESSKTVVFTGRPHAEMTVDVDEMAALAGSHDVKVIDARAPERYLGEIETIDRAAGHIPGAVNHFYRWNLNEDGTLASPDELSKRWRRTLSGITPDRVVSYCGSGVTACQNLLVLEHIGLRGARLYPGSWSEWSSDPSRPIATGREGGPGDGWPDQ
jgi:thiosulfate/3-mercaptopyruvate sulfurtransferase